MTEESAPPAPSPELPPVEATPVIPPEAVKEISQEITEAVKDAIMQEAPAVESPPAAQSQPTTPPSQQKSSAHEHMLTVVRARKAERLEKVMEMVREKRVITNDDVEKLFKVSDATATNYLRELVKAGRLKAIGHDGGARYEPLSH